MARNPDSVVDISLDFDTTPAENSISDLGKKVAKAFSATGQGDPLATLNNDIKTTEANIDNLKKKLASITSDPEELAKAALYEKQLQTLQQKAIALEPASAEAPPSKEYLDTLDKIMTLEEEYSKLKATGTDAEAYAQANAQLTDQENILTALKSRVEELKQAEQEETDEENKNTTAHNKNSVAIQRQSKKHKSGLVNILKYALGIRTLYTLVSKVKAAMKEGITWVSNYSSEVKDNINQIKGAFKMMTASIGAAITPIINALTPVIVKIAQAFTTAANAVAKFMAILLGQKTVIVAKKNIDAYTKSLEKGSKALGAYDELNVIKNEDNEGVDYFETLNTANIEKTGLLALADKIRTFFTETLPGFFAKLKTWWAELDTPSKIGIIVMAVLLLTLVIIGIVSALGKVKESLGVLSNPLTGVVDLLTKALILAEIIALVYAFKEVIEATTELIKVFSESGLEWYDVLLLLVSIFGVLTLALWAAVEIIDHNKLATLLLIGVLLALAPVLDSCANLIKIFSESGLEWYEVGGLLVIMLGVLIGLFAAIAILGPSMTVGLLPFIAVMATLALTLDPILSAIGNFIQQTAPALVDVIDAIGEAISRVIEAVGSVITDTLNGIAEIIDSVTELLNTVDSKGFELVAKIVSISVAVGDLTDDIKTLASTVKDKFPEMKTTITNNWDSIYKKISSGVSDLKLLILSPFVRYMKSDVFDRIKGDLESFKGSFKTKLNTMVGYLQTFANGVVNAFNAVIDSINSLGVSIPDWVPDYGGRSWYPNLAHVNHVTIPRLAKGAVLPPNSPFLAMLGDQKSGTNIEAPLATIKQAFAEVMRQSGNNQPILLQLDGKTIAKVVWNENEKRYRQVGRSYGY